MAGDVFAASAAKRLPLPNLGFLAMNHPRKKWTYKPPMMAETKGANSGHFKLNQ